MSMERPNSRRHKADESRTLILTGNEEAAADVNEKKTKRHWFVSNRYTCRSCLQQPSTQRHASRLFLFIIGIIGIFQVARNVHVNVFPRRAAMGYPLIESPLVIPRVSGETLMKEARYKSRPRSMGIYFQDASSQSYFGSERLDKLHRPHMSHTAIDVSKDSVKAQLNLRNSRDYEHGMQDEFESGDCKAQHEWQLKSFPACNQLHEHDLGLVTESTVKILGSGYWRDVWRVKDGQGDKQVLKTIRYEHDYEDRNYDRHRRDALAMERLTSSPNIVDIYAFCGNSGIFEYAPGGDLEDMLWYSDEKWNSTEKLIVSYQVALGISDVHNVEGNGRPSIAHTDITTSQFVYSDGRYKLNDFNRCRFITWNEKKNKQCGFHVGNNPGNVRSVVVLRLSCVSFAVV